MGPGSRPGRRIALIGRIALIARALGVVERLECFFQLRSNPQTLNSSRRHRLGLVARIGLLVWLKQHRRCRCCFLTDVISADQITPWRSFRSENRTGELSLLMAAAGHLVQRGFVKRILLIASRNLWLARLLIRPNAFFIDLLV
jgi:hypothetical protein